MKTDLRRALIIWLVTFVVSGTLGMASELFLGGLSLPLSILVLGAIVFVGIVFDIVGTAVTAANERPLHAMAAKRIAGAKQAIRLIRNADRVANFCNDMVGDVCGTMSGAVGASIVYVLVAQRPAVNEPISSVLIVAFTAAFTVAGKALGKGYALTSADDIIFNVGRFLGWLERKFGLQVLGLAPSGKRNAKVKAKRRPKLRNGQTP